MNRRALKITALSTLAPVVGVGTVMAVLDGPMTKREADHACERKGGDDATFNQATKEYTCRNPRTGKIIARWPGR